MKTPYGRSKEAHIRRQKEAIRKLKERQEDIQSSPKWTMEQKYLNLLIMAEMINNDNATVDELARYFGRKYWSIENYKRTLMELGLIYE